MSHETEAFVLDWRGENKFDKTYFKLKIDFFKAFFVRTMTVQFSFSVDFTMIITIIQFYEKKNYLRSHTRRVRSKN